MQTVNCTTSSGTAEASHVERGKAVHGSSAFLEATGAMPQSAYDSGPGSAQHPGQLQTTQGLPSASPMYPNPVQQQAHVSTSHSHSQHPPQWGYAPNNTNWAPQQQQQQQQQIAASAPGAYQQPYSYNYHGYGTSYPYQSQHGSQQDYGYHQQPQHPYQYHQHHQYYGAQYPQHHHQQQKPFQDHYQQTHYQYYHQHQQQQHQQQQQQQQQQNYAWQSYHAYGTSGAPYDAPNPGNACSTSSGSVPYTASMPYSATAASGAASSIAVPGGDNVAVHTAATAANAASASSITQQREGGQHRAAEGTVGENSSKRRWTAQGQEQLQHQEQGAAEAPQQAGAVASTAVTRGTPAAPTAPQQHAHPQPPPLLPTTSARKTATTTVTVTVAAATAPTPTAASSSSAVDLIVVWDLDETLIIFNSLLSGAYARAAAAAHGRGPADSAAAAAAAARVAPAAAATVTRDGGVSNEAGSGVAGGGEGLAAAAAAATSLQRRAELLGQRLADLVFDFCDDHMDFRALDGLDPLNFAELWSQACTSSASSGQQPATDASATTRDNTANPAICNTSTAAAIVPKRSTLERIARVYSSGADGLSDVLGTAGCSKLAEALAEAEELTGGWVAAARRLLTEVTSAAAASAEGGAPPAAAEVTFRRVRHVLVSAGHLVATLGKLLLWGLDEHFDIRDVYSASGRPKLACFRALCSRFGPNSAYVAVGDGAEEQRAAAVMGWGFVRVALHGRTAPPPQPQPPGEQRQAQPGACSVE
ncbi:hypothetical protein Agub_g10600, partial [Astrephomene gubernaculifera]